MTVDAAAAQRDGWHISSLDRFSIRKAYACNSCMRCRVKNRPALETHDRRFVVVLEQKAFPWHSIASCVALSKRQIHFVDERIDGWTMNIRRWMRGNATHETWENLRGFCAAGVVFVVSWLGNGRLCFKLVKNCFKIAHNIEIFGYQKYCFKTKKKNWRIIRSIRIQLRSYMLSREKRCALLTRFSPIRPNSQMPAVRAASTAN